MAKGAFSCARCHRTFSMAAHLARHMSTIHARGSKRKARQGTRRRGRPTLARSRRLGRVMMRRSIRDGATGLLTQMQAYHTDLTSRRVALDSEINAIATAMQALGGTGRRTRGTRRSRRRIVRGRRRGRPSGGSVRAGSLKDYIARVLRQTGKAMGPNEIGTSVIRAGYRTKSKDLTKAVSNTLPQIKSIRRVGFGAYRIA